VGSHREAHEGAEVRELRFEYPELPVSVNKLYIHRHGHKVLSTEGREYRNRFVTSCGGIPPQTLAAFEANPELPYELNLWFLLRPARLFNLTYGIDKRVKSPYADIDVTNLTKLVEDCIAVLVGIRDRNNFDVHQHKREADPRGERVIAILRPLAELREVP
jgi:hypothetical protein